MITLAIALVALVAIYLYGTRNFSYWLKKGVKQEKPLVYLGTSYPLYFGQKSLSRMLADTYFKFPNERVVGIYRSSRPQLLLRDPDLIKRVLVTDFQCFYDRGVITQPKEVTEPLLYNLFFANGDIWRMLRQRITPAFSSGKLRAMFPLIVERAEKLQARALSAATANREMDARDLMARYTTDFIGACAFGLDADSLNEEDSAFRKLGVDMFTFDKIDILKITLKETFPETFKHLKVFGKIEKSILGLVSTILKQRNYEHSGRNDFIDLLLDCRKKGKMVVESIDKLKPDGTPDTVSLELTEEIMAAQVFVFFAAGFETSSSATSYTLHQLAYHPEVQKKVQDDIDRVLAKHNNKLSYDSIKEMTYLECAFKEGMRMFPSVGSLSRVCMRKYTFPELDLTIDPGVDVVIPLHALHNDPQYFEEPHVFHPERFLPDQVDEKTKFVYLPFGEGSRACIGLRMGLMQSLAGLAALLSRFTVAPGPSTLRDPEIEPKSGVVQLVKNGLPLSFKVRELKIV